MNGFKKSNIRFLINILQILINKCFYDFIRVQIGLEIKRIAIERNIGLHHKLDFLPNELNNLKSLIFKIIKMYLILSMKIQQIIIIIQLDIIFIKAQKRNGRI